MKALTEFKIGDKLIVKSIEDNELGHRLMELGLLPGEIISIQLLAPFGDPISLSIGDYQLSIRKSDAKNIFVEKI